MRIVVTESDIAKAREMRMMYKKSPATHRYSPYQSCPIAQAFKRRGIRFEVVRPSLVIWEGSQDSPFPKKVTKWINGFDRNPEFVPEPITFDVEVPDGFARTT